MESTQDAKGLGLFARLATKNGRSPSFWASAYRHNGSARFAGFATIVDQETFIWDLSEALPEHQSEEDLGDPFTVPPLLLSQFELVMSFYHQIIAER